MRSLTRHWGEVQVTGLLYHLDKQQEIHIQETRCQSIGIRCVLYRRFKSLLSLTEKLVYLDSYQAQNNTLLSNTSSMTISTELQLFQLEEFVGMFSFSNLNESINRNVMESLYTVSRWPED